MSANSPSIRIARTNRILAVLGHSDVIEALKHAEEMRSALRAIRVWAMVNGSLDPRHVRELTGKALRIGDNAEITGA